MTKAQPIRPGHERGGTSFNARFSRRLSWLLAKLKVEGVPHIKRIIVTVVGGTILILGAALIFLPVPGSGPMVILGGLAVLGDGIRLGAALAAQGQNDGQQGALPDSENPRSQGKETYHALEASLRADQQDTGAAKPEQGRDITSEQR